MASLPDAGSTTSSDILHIIRPRPPTPPRETCRDPVVVPPKPISSRTGQPDAASSHLQTPPDANTPTSTAVDPSLDPSLKSHRKRVEWSAHTQYKEYTESLDICSFGSFGTLERLDSRSSPSCSAPSPRPIKGILKSSQSHRLDANHNHSHSHNHNYADGLPSTSAPNIVDMLDSTIKQLAGPDRDSKIDAYMMLSRALKATNNLPDRVALKNQMSLFMQFIQRDLSHRDDKGNLDSSLANHALTLLATFSHFPAIAATLTSDFGIWMLDYSIRALEDPSTPKDVLRHIMPVVGAQSLSPKLVTAARIGRLVKALHQLENHVTGKGIVLSRLRIYRRLVRQHKGHMALHVDWLKDVFMDMLSVVRDIQAHAIDLATEAGFALRSDWHVKQKVNDIFKTADMDKDTQYLYIDFFIQRLQEMLGERPASAAVPRIWSAVILYLPYPLEKWRHYSAWLTVAQRAFNTDDATTKQEANHAWNRHVYLELQASKVGPKTLELLCRPLVSQLQRKSDSRNLETALRLRKSVMGGICNLFYYSLAPEKDTLSPDLVWDAVVQPVMTQLISLDGKPDNPLDCVVQAAHLLAGLLDVTTPRVWRQDRIQETPPASPDELPSLDAKWIRRNCEKAMLSVGPIIEKRFLELADKDSIIFRLWHSLVGSVAVASAKDIKVSDDTVKFFASTFGLLSRIWATGGQGDNTAAFLPSVKSFIGVLVGALGLLPFTEKRLLLLRASNTYEPLPTPYASDRPQRSDAIERPVLHHLFVMLSSLPPGLSDDDALTDVFLAGFGPFFGGKTAVARIELAFELLNLLPPDAPPPNCAWILAAHNFRLILEKSRDDGTLLNSSDHSKILGPRYRDIISLLERGLANHHDLPAEQWFSLFDRLSDHVAQEFGEAGRCIVLVEPVAKAILDMHGAETKKRKWNNLALRAFRELVEVARFPRDRASLEIARHRLWGTPMNTTRGSVFDPFEYLYKCGNHVLESFYSDLSSFDADNDVAPTIDAVKDFIIRCLPLSGVRTLSRLQSGLCPWLRDAGSLLSLGGQSSLTNSVSSAWNEISAQVADRRPLDATDFGFFEPVLTAALQSKHLGIMSRAVETWNLLVQNEESPACSDSLKGIVSNLVSTVDPPAEQASSQAQPEAEASLVLLSSSSSQQNVQAPLSSSASESTSSSKRSRRKRRSETMLDASRTKTAKRAAADSRESSSSSLPENPRRTPQANANMQVGSRTPRHSSAFRDVTSVTPTPRRGQSLHLADGDGDAASPPNPRPYPLLSEIQSRARNMDVSDTEDWRFSSPVGTPMTDHRQGLGVLKPPAPPATSLRTDTEMLDLSGEQERRLPSEQGRVDPQTPRRQHSKAGRDEAPEAAVNKGSLDANAKLAPCLPSSSSESLDTSYTLSELDESSVQKLIIELESHDNTSSNSGRDSTEKQRDEEATERPGKKKPGRKRKSSGPPRGSDGEKRRRVDTKEHEIPAAPAPPTPQDQGVRPERSLRRSTRRIPSSGISYVQTRGSAKRSSQSSQQDEIPAQDQDTQERPKQHDEGTDDEVLSQLMAESGGPSGSGGKVESLVRVLQSGLDGLRIASLTREEVYRMEDMLMDMKRELFAAEKRGRGGIA